MRSIFGTGMKSAASLLTSTSLVDTELDMISHAISRDMPHHDAEGTWRFAMCDGGPPEEVLSFLFVQLDPLDRSHLRNRKLEAWWRTDGDLVKAWGTEDPQ